MNKAIRESDIVATSSELWLVQQCERWYLVEAPNEWWKRPTAALVTLGSIAFGILFASICITTRNSVAMTLGVVVGTMLVVLSVVFFIWQLVHRRKRCLLPLEQYVHHGCFDTRHRVFFSPLGAQCSFEELTIGPQYCCGLSFVCLVIKIGDSQIMRSRVRHTMPFAFARVLSKLRQIDVR